METKDLNRLKVVLAEKSAQTSGLLSNLAKTLPPSPNGVLITLSPLWKTYWI